MDGFVQNISWPSHDSRPAAVDQAADADAVADLVPRDGRSTAVTVPAISWPGVSSADSAQRPLVAPGWMSGGRFRSVGDVDEDVVVAQVAAFEGDRLRRGAPADGGQGGVVVGTGKGMASRPLGRRATFGSSTTTCAVTVTYRNHASPQHDKVVIAFLRHSSRRHGGGDLRLAARAHRVGDRCSAWSREPALGCSDPTPAPDGDPGGDARRALRAVPRPALKLVDSRVALRRADRAGRALRQVLRHTLETSVRLLELTISSPRTSPRCGWPRRTHRARRELYLRKIDLPPRRRCGAILAGVDSSSSAPGSADIPGLARWRLAQHRP